MSSLLQWKIIGADGVPFSTGFDMLLAKSKEIAPVTTPEMFERIWKGSMLVIVSGEYTDSNIYALIFNRFVTVVAARTSQLLNYKALADDADIDMVTAKAWVNILETLGITFLLHPYSNNVSSFSVSEGLISAKNSAYFPNSSFKYLLGSNESIGLSISSELPFIR